MNSTMLTILSLSVSGSLMALILIFANRICAKKLPRAFSYYIWILVLLRLTVPVSAPVNVMETVFFAPHSASEVQTEQAAEDTAHAQAAGGAAAADAAADNGAARTDAEAQRGTAFSAAGLLSTLDDNILWIWAAGAALSILWFVASYLIFQEKLRSAGAALTALQRAEFRRISGGRRVNAYRSRLASTPMLVGLIRPRVVIPYDAMTTQGSNNEFENVLRHELTHYDRKDLLYKWLVVIVTSLHWFNPLMVLVRRETARACELACDEAVIQKMTAKEKQSYGNTLLELSASRHLKAGVIATTLCEEKKELKERLLSIMNYKKRTVWVALMCVLLAAALTGCSVALGAASPTDKGNAEPVVVTPAADGSKQPVATVEPEKSAESAKMIADVKDYILNDQKDRPNAGKLLWSKSFLEAADLDAAYQSYISAGGKKDDTKAFAEYITENAVAPSNWKELFEKDLMESDGRTPVRYEDLGDGVFQVYVNIDGQSVPYVTVDSKTGWYHG